jgi:hypothetical protein
MSMRLIAAIATLLAARAAYADAPDAQVLERVNAFRKAAGLGAVSLDADLSKGCMEHAEYMKKNKGTQAMEGLNAHTQRADLPGASAAGAACGKAADLFPGVSDLAGAVDGWMAGIYHRRPMMDPALTKVGFGYAKLDDGSYMAALMFAKSKSSASGWPVAYPASAQKDVPLEYGAEIPNPIPNNGRGGYAVTLQFPAFDKVTGVKVTLTAGPDGKSIAVPFHLSDPEHPATSFGQYGVVSIIPKQALDPSTKYTVKISATWKGKPQTWTWSFTTLGLRSVDASDETAIEGAVGIASRVHGTVTHAAMMDTSTVFLSLADGPKRKLVSVLVPLDVWKQLTKNAKPAAYKGRTLDVTSTPMIVQGKYINLPISSARQLTFAPKTAPPKK